MAAPEARFAEADAQAVAGSKDLGKLSDAKNIRPGYHKLLTDANLGIGTPKTGTVAGTKACKTVKSGA